MNRPEAYKIISSALEEYRDLGFVALSGRVGTKSTDEVLAPSGVRYTLEVSIAWADGEHRVVVIHGRIDDQNTFRSIPLEERIRLFDAV